MIERTTTITYKKKLNILKVKKRKKNEKNKWKYFKLSIKFRISQIYNGMSCFGMKLN